MKIKESVLRKIIRKFIKEASSSSSATQRATRRGSSGKAAASRKTTDAEQKFGLSTDRYNSALSGYKDASDLHQDYTDMYDTHVAGEPEQTQADTSKWVHPQTNQITTMGDGDTQPAKGWSYRQSTVTPGKTDTTKWTHPYSKVTTNVTKQAPQPQSGWGYTQADSDTSQWTSPYEPGAKKGTFKTTALQKGQKQPDLGWTTVQKGKTGYGHGTTQDYKKAQTLYKTISAPKKTTNPYFGVSKQNPGKTTYGSGNTVQYNTAVAGAGTAGQSGYTKIGATTNPTSPSSTSYANQTGQGSSDEYSTAQDSAGRDQWAVGDTTNPQGPNPDYGSWSTTRDSLSGKVAKAKSRKDSTSTTKDVEQSKQSDDLASWEDSKAEDQKSFGKQHTIDTPSSGGKGSSMASASGGWGSGKASSGKGKGRGSKGKGRAKGSKGKKGKKGKKSKKEESLINKNNIISETIKPKRSTIREIKIWMKSLEENRYKKIPQADARRVAWFVNNNLAEDYEAMPKSIVKKWSKAAYGRERFLAKEFMKSKKKRT